MAKRLRLFDNGLGVGKRELSAAQFQYVVRVHRQVAGAQLVLFDPDTGMEANARLLEVDKRRALVEVGEPRTGAQPGFSKLRLFLGLGKGDKPDRVIKECTALGIGRLTLVSSERSVVRLSDNSERKQQRHRETAIDSARQCGRSDIPQLDPLCSIADCLAIAPAGHEWLLHPEGGQPLSQRLDGLVVGEPLALWIGPEGGFSDRELAGLRQRGALAVSLGPLVLRTELAAVASVAAVVSRWHAVG